MYENPLVGKFIITKYKDKETNENNKARVEDRLTDGRYLVKDYNDNVAYIVDPEDIIDIINPWDEMNEGEAILEGSARLQRTPIFRSQVDHWLKNADMAEKLLSGVKKILEEIREAEFQQWQEEMKQYNEEE